MSHRPCIASIAPLACALALAGCTSDTDVSPPDLAVSCDGGGVVLCEGRCVDPMSDDAHCGGCGTACDKDHRCVAGRCALRCLKGLSVCSDTCVNTATDPTHCGDCATACPAGHVCSSGKCTLSCQQGLTNCDGACVNATTDPAHCGDCATKCPAGNACAAGKCTLACQTGLTDCVGTCVNLTSDPAHCGDCPTKCPAGNACAAGKCALSCQQGLTECGGTCVSLATDNAHCGGCGKACGAGTVCANGQCAASCQAPLVVCGGACVDTRFDPANCGGCGKACALANATAACTQGACVIARCSTGYRDCDGDGANGCEVDVTTSAANCGACGKSCPSGTCANGACTATCTDGARNGGETDIDCGGGTCPKCGAGKACAAASDCSDGVCDAGRCRLPASCKELKTLAPASQSGSYAIDPDGPGGNAPITVYCDMTLGGGGWTTPGQALVTGLIAYWNMDESDGAVADLMGTYNGTRTADSGSGPSVATAKFGNGRQFSKSVKDRIMIPEIAMGNTQSYTFAYWMRTSDTSGAWGAVFGDRVANATELGYRSQQPAMWFINSGGSGVWVAQGGTISDGAWRHYAFVKVGRQGDTTWKMYVNGAYVTSLTFTYKTGIEGVNKMGCTGSTNWECFDGVIDDVAVWNVALGDADVQALYGWYTTRNLPLLSR